MKYYERKLVTVVTEGALEGLLTKELLELGVSGYTISDARGRGARGVRGSEWDASNNIRVEIVCDAEMADRIASHLSERFYADYAMIAYVSDVGVFRSGKF